MAQVFSCVFREISKNTLFTEQLCRIEKKSAFFSGSKEIAQRNAILSHENMQIFTRIQYLILPGCLEFALQIIIQNTSISHARRQTFNRGPNFVKVPRLCTIQSASNSHAKNTPQNTFFTEQPPLASVKFHLFFKKGKKQK